jgi:formylglycine-generating enzyme required for sulfatase activity
MAGSVFEWVLDFRTTAGYADHVTEGCGDPGHDCASLTPDPAGYRTIRGGAFSSLGDSLRSAYRSNFDPDKTLRSIGFRCARSL